MATPVERARLPFEKVDVLPVASGRESGLSRLLQRTPSPRSSPSPAESPPLRMSPSPEPMDQTDDSNFRTASPVHFAVTPAVRLLVHAIQAIGHPHGAVSEVLCVKPGTTLPRGTDIPPPLGDGRMPLTVREVPRSHVGPFHGAASGAPIRVVRATAFTRVAVPDPSREVSPEAKEASVKLRLDPQEVAMKLRKAFPGAVGSPRPDGIHFRRHNQENNP